jgi:hypothetical protein
LRRVADNEVVRPLLDDVSWIVVGYAGLVALVSAYAGWRWRAKPPWLAQLGWMLELLAGVRALLGLTAVGAITPDERATHLGYLAASVCIMPLALRSVKDDEGGWAVGVVGVAAVAVLVVSVRMVSTL